MIARFLLVAGFAFLAAQGKSHEDSLGTALDEGRLKVVQVDARLENPTKEYLELIADRRESLEWEHKVQKENVDRCMSAAIFKGMLRNNQFSTFRCISKAVSTSVEKIEASRNNVQNITELVLQRGLEEVKGLRLITKGMIDYVEDLYGKTLEELKKEKEEKGKDKILQNVRTKMSLMETILVEVEKKAKETKFKFFEEYIQYAHDTENYLRKTAREGGQKAFKCVS